MNNSNNTLLSVQHLKVHFAVRRGGRLLTHKAVDGVDLHIRTGQTFGLVGESGCGKSTLARAIMLLERPTAGDIRFAGSSLVDMSPRQLRRSRRQLQIVFQDPNRSLDPRMTVGEILMEPPLVHNMAPGKQTTQLVPRMLKRVGLSGSDARRYPHEFSGGQRQRICIARALMTEPRLLICDEATSALDVSVQAEILQLLIRLKQQLNLSYLFISHDLGIVQHISDDVAVMHNGRIVEQQSRERLFSNPEHPYTRKLFDAVPVPDPRFRRRR